MKRISFLFAAVFVAALTLFACAKGYESEKRAGDLKITLSVDRYPLVKDDNTMKIKVADSSGILVSDATVNVRYYMPPMPGMAPMDYNTQAVLKGDSYAFSANIPMEGGWKTEVSVVRPGKPAATTIFNLDAR